MNLYLIRTREPLDQAIGRISFSLHDEFCLQLTYRSNVHESIHNARLCIKRQRAVLRLVRSAIGEEVYHTANIEYRDISRQIAFLRDYSACLDAVTGLQKNRRSPSLDQHLSRLHRRIFQLRARALASTETEELFAMLSNRMRLARGPISGWDLTRLQDEIISAGVFRLFRQGKRRLQLAIRDPGEETFHQLRKSLKYLFYVNQLLQELWPAVIEAQLREYKSMTSLLGAHHDLYVLDKLFDEMIPPGASREYRSRLRQAIWKKKQKLEEDILKGMLCIYAEEADSYADRIKKLWQVTHTG